MDTLQVTTLKKMEKREKVFSGIKLAAALGVLLYFFINTKFYIYHGTVMPKRIGMMLVLAVTLVVLSIFKFTFSKKMDRSISIILGLFSVILSYILSEIVIREPKCAVNPTNFWNKELLWNVVNITVMLLLFLIIMLITNSIRVASITINVAIVVFSIVICVVYELRGVPMMASDVATFRTAMNVASEYKIGMSFWKVMAFVICMILVYMFSQLHEVRYSKKYVLRGASFVIVLALSVVFAQKVVLSDYLENHNINVRMFRPMESYQKYGVATTFLRSVNYARVKKPENYSVEKVKQIISKYEASDTATADDTSKNPNIITIVNESFSDINVLGDFKTSEDAMPFFRSLKKNTVRGYTYASIVGGQTANTEFEFLTGSSLGFLSSDVTAFQLYIHEKTPSLVSNLKLNGYGGNHAFHPFNPANYNRPTVYPLLGFSSIISKYDMPENAKMVRDYYSDDADIDMVLKQYETYKKNHTNPFYMYNLTIQNHSPYDANNENFNQPITIESSKSDAGARCYLNLIKYSDDSLKKIVNYFKKVKEPTIIMFFGDHQPRLTDEFLSKITNGTFSTWSNEQMMTRYKVPFVIWANYDIKESYVEKTSMNYLQSILAKTSGVKMSGYQKYLNELRKQVPTITSHGYWGKNGKYYAIDDKKSPYYDIIEEYRTIQYNMLFDTKNRVNSFFEVGAKSK